jgi:hypothetical protein
MKIKLNVQFVCKSQDESFKPSCFIIRQCLSNKNENATVLKSKNFLHLNKALEGRPLTSAAAYLIILEPCSIGIFLGS